MQHALPFDPTYGYSPDQLLKVPAPAGPPDFAAFWRRTHAQTLQIPLRLERRRIASPDARYDVFEVEFNSLDGVRVGGWVTIPADGKFDRAFVVGHGYGGRDAPDPGLLPPAAAIFPCARGFHRSARPDIPGDCFQHVLHGIASRETYVHRGCAAELWSAASALLELYPAAESRLNYYGGSFGGGMGALMLPWDERFRRAFLDVPSFGHHPLRVTLPCVGSGKSVSEYFQGHPEVLDVLAYFDSATAARHTTTPVFVAAAVFDPAVPPPGQFAVYNALAGPKELFVRRAAHFAHRHEAAENRELTTRLQRWFA